MSRISKSANLERLEGRYSFRGLPRQELVLQRAKDNPGMNLINFTCYEGLAKIGDYAFYNCASLTSLTIPSTVTNIGSRAFGFCVALPSFEVAPSNAFYTNIAGVLLNKSQTRLVQCPGGKAGAYAIPSSVTSIGFEAFEGCTNLSSVTIPNTVTNIAVGAFSDCYSLTQITMPSNLTSIAAYTFNYCRKLNRITIPAGVTTIGDYAFNSCSALQNVYFKTNPPSLGTSVFDADDNTIIYHLPGMVDWGATFGKPANRAVETAAGDRCQLRSAVPAARGCRSRLTRSRRTLLISAIRNGRTFPAVSIACAGPEFHQA